MRVPRGTQDVLRVHLPLSPDAVGPESQMTANGMGWGEVSGSEVQAVEAGGCWLSAVAFSKQDWDWAPSVANVCRRR